MGHRKNTDYKHIKFCIKCEKDFNDKENYNWSCIFHQGVYCMENDLWWCCGKQGPTAKGCKRSQHQVKEEFNYGE